MQVPQQVQDAIRRGDEIRQSAYGTPGEPAPQDELNPAPAEGGQAAAPKDPKEPRADDLKDSLPKDEPKAADTPTAPDKTETVVYWRNRFEVMQGKYNTELPELRKQVRERDQKIAELEAKQTEQAAPLDVTKLNELTEDEIAEYGPDLVGFVQKVVKLNGDNSGVATLQAKIDKLEAQLSQREADEKDDREATFWTKLERAHADFASINQSPKFHAFLAGTNPATGNPYQSDLEAAQKRADAHTVIEIFDAFKRMPAPAPEPKPGNKVPEEMIEQPRNVGGGDLPPVHEPRRWTRADVSQFYKDVATGKLSDADKAQMQAEIFEALQNGRIG